MSWFVYGLTGSSGDAVLAVEVVLALIVNMAHGRISATKKKNLLSYP